jgi:nucleotidyltransferase substrate binding protein (TIGR01987 family)
MDKLNEKHTQLLRAISTLNTTLTIFEKVKRGQTCCATHKDQEEEYRIHRDSVIQRFEYCIDLLWKHLKKYLERAHLTSEPTIPTEIVRRTCAEKIITEAEAESILELIKSRNKTSHIYVEEIAEHLVKLIPAYYDVMLCIAKKLAVNS